MILFYPLAKDGNELLKNKQGFIFLEALVTLTIILTTASIIIPTSILLKKERQLLIDQQIISTKLHDFIQPYIWESKPINSDLFIFEVNHRRVNIFVTIEEELIKGCAHWENVKHKNEVFCLYGPKK